METVVQQLSNAVQALEARLGSFDSKFAEVAGEFTNINVKLEIADQQVQQEKLEILGPAGAAGEGRAGEKADGRAPANECCHGGRPARREAEGG